jgi:predicted nucleic acid-binding protein
MAASFDEAVPASSAGRRGGRRLPYHNTSRPLVLKSIVSRTVTIVDLQIADYERMAEHVPSCADFPLGTTDAPVIAVAERLNVTEVPTLDHRHFRAIRPRHVSAFTLLP